MSPLAIAGAVGIGLSLGLTGAGGSILTLPVLVHLAGMPPQQAVGPSLLIVGLAAFVGCLQRARAGDIHYRAVGMFGVSGAVGAVLGSRLTPLLSPDALMLVFAALMGLVAVRMFRPIGSEPRPLPECKPVRCLGAGLITGILTGFLGVGGGFLLVPALMRFARLPLKMAAGTSLAIIAVNAAVGFLSHLGATPIPWTLVGVYSALAALGAWGGGAISSRLPGQGLRRAFAWLVAATAAFVVWRVVGT